MSSRVTLSCTREGIFDGLNDSSLAEKEFVRQVEQAVAHPLAQLGDEVKPIGHQKLHIFGCKTKRLLAGKRH